MKTYPVALFLAILAIQTHAADLETLASGSEEKAVEAETGAETPAAGVVAKKQDTVYSLTDELIVQLNNLGDSFESAKDKASGEGFVKKIAIIGDEIESIAARMAKLDTPGDEERAHLEEKMKNSTKGFRKKFGTFFMTFVQNDELGNNVGSAMTEFQARMDKLPPFFDRGGQKKEDTAQAPPAPAAEVPTTLKKILAEATDYDDLEYGDDENEGLLCTHDGLIPYTGWSKMVSKKGQVENLEHYKDGKQHGLEIMWYENGQKYSEINYRDGKKHGLQNLWYENGQKESELTRKDGEFHGPVTKWWENGNMCYSKNYLDGEYHGLSTEWHENGQKKNETNYNDGEKNGLQTWWDNDGNVIRQSRWKIGREVETIK